MIVESFSLAESQRFTTFLRLTLVMSVHSDGQLRLDSKMATVAVPQWWHRDEVHAPSFLF